MQKILVVLKYYYNITLRYLNDNFGCILSKNPISFFLFLYNQDCIFCTMSRGGMMNKKILVTYASKEGETIEIAERIGKDLVEKGLQVDVMPVREVKKIASYDAVVVGSCVYIGQWNEDATMFVKQFENDLKFIPVWIFSSDPTDAGDIYRLVRGWRLPRIVQKYVDRIEPEGITIFHGHVDHGQTSWLENWMKGKSENEVNILRDWHKVDNWATQIAAHFV